MRLKTVFSRLALLGLGGLLLAASPAAAQQLNQMKLTDALITQFVAAHDDYVPLADQMREAGEDTTDALMAKLNGIAQKHGFKDFGEYEDVRENISIVLDGLDPETGVYTDPVEKMKKERDALFTDETLPEEDRKLAVDDIEQEIAVAEPLQFKQNVEVVKRNRKAIEIFMPAETDEATGGAAPGGIAPESKSNE